MLLQETTRRTMNWTLIILNSRIAYILEKVKLAYAQESPNFLKPPCFDATLLAVCFHRS